MNLSSITNLFSHRVLPVLNSAVPGTATNTSPASIGGQTPDSGQLSPFAQILSTLQQLQQSDPAKYERVTGQIATNLQNAANTGQREGNTGEATQLNQLATDFTSAAKSGQLPNVQDLAAALAGGGHHHQGHAGSSSIDASQQSAQTSGTQNSSLDPLAIIQQTLTSSGIAGSNS